MRSNPPLVVGLLLAVAMMSSCGGESPTNPQGPGATATPAPASTATAAPTATPVPVPTEPPEDDNPGPVATVGTHVFVAASAPPNQGGEIRSGPYYDPDSNTDVVYLGEFAIFDSTPKNVAGRKCCRDANVSWHFENSGLFEHIGGSNKFQYRVLARRRGTAQVYTVIDGVRSNPILNVQIR